MRLGSIILLCLAAEAARGQLSLDIDTAPVTILPGQMLTVRLTLSNKSASEIQKVPTLAVARFYVGFEDGSLKEYTRASHFSVKGLETGTVALAPNAKITGWTTILYNKAPTVDHLRPVVAARIEHATLMAPFAFERPGNYRIKAIIRLGDQVIESQEVPLSVLEPEGLDVDAWELLQKAPELALIVQEGGEAVTNPDRRNDLAQKLDDFRRTFPEFSEGWTVSANSVTKLPQ